MFLGLDLGTSGLKAILVDTQSNVIGSHTEHYPVSRPQKGWSEQDPCDWVAACEQVFLVLKAAYPDQMAAVRSLAISGHMHGAVVVDKTGAPLRPCILWDDTRSVKEAERLNADPAFGDISGNIVFPGFTAPKVLWIETHEPDLFPSIYKVLLPKDFLLHWLTGRFVTDRSDAAGTGWLNVADGQWAETLLSKSHMRLDQMPDLLNGCDVVGIAVPDLAKSFGFSDQVKVVAGGADNGVAACGVGAINDGAGFVSLGTSGVVLVARDQFAPAPETAVHTFCHTVPDTWFQMGVSLSATNSLNWLAGIVGLSPQDLSALCRGPINGPSPVVFLPYLAGERTPHNDADVGGAFVGLRHETTTKEMCQAVMEGVCFALRDCLEALKSTGTNVDELLAIGGGTQSDFWLESLATVLNIRLLLPERGEFGAAMGAARLAMIGDGASIQEILTKPAIAREIDPCRTLVQAYEDAYQRFRRLYPLAKDAI